MAAVTYADPATHTRHRRSAEVRQQVASSFDSALEQSQVIQVEFGDDDDPSRYLAACYNEAKKRQLQITVSQNKLSRQASIKIIGPRE